MPCFRIRVSVSVRFRVLVRVIVRVMVRVGVRVRFRVRVRGRVRVRDKVTSGHRDCLRVYVTAKIREHLPKKGIINLTFISDSLISGCSPSALG